MTERSRVGEPRHGAGPRLALVAALLVLMALPFLPFRAPGFWVFISNAGHFPFFAVLTVLVYRTAGRGWRGTPARYRGSFAISAALALGTELLQPLVGRTASLADLLLDLLGIAAGLSGVWVWRRTDRGPRLAHLLGSATLLGLLLHPAYLEWRAEVWRARSFPTIGEFDTPIEMRLWNQLQCETEDSGGIRFAVPPDSPRASALEIRIPAGSWCGALYEAGGLDWTQLAALALDVYNPAAEPFPLRLRLETREEGWFVHKQQAPYGWSKISIPTTEIRERKTGDRLDLRSVERMMLFTGANQPARVIYVDHVRLEGQRGLPESLQ